MSAARVVATALAALLTVQSALAHGFQPGLLQVTARQPGVWDLFWLVPDGGEMPADWQLQPSQGCQLQAQQQAITAQGRVHWMQLICTADAGELRVLGLSPSRGEVVVQQQNGAQSQILRGDQDSVRLGLEATRGGRSAWDYVEAGFRHILAGWDHLALVLLLALLVRKRGALLGAVSGFTVAHSLTLALVALDWVRVPQTPVEALIALSVAALAADVVLAHRGVVTLTARYPWLVASAFGLLHGTGFAAALRELGFDQAQLLEPLLAFNAGVELGQLAFLALVGLLGMVLRGSWVPPARLAVVRTMGIVSAAAFALRAIDSLGWGG